MSVLVALTRNDIADYVEALFLVYLILIFARILLSWIPRLPDQPLPARSRRLHPPGDRPVPEPVPACCRLSVGAASRSIHSPIIAVVVLLIAQTVVVNLIAD